MGVPVIAVFQKKPKQGTLPEDKAECHSDQTQTVYLKLDDRGLMLKLRLYATCCVC